MSPPEAFPPELARVTLFRVFLPSTLFRESPASFGIEDLWGASGRQGTTESVLSDIAENAVYFSY
jgi:hypothetical protein